MARFRTPHEAAIEAEVEILRAQCRWYEAMVGPADRVTAYGVEREIGTVLYGQSVKLPLSSSVRGMLNAGGNYTVVARTHDRGLEDFTVSYFTAGAALPYEARIDSLVRLHEEFIKVLAERLGKR